ASRERSFHSAAYSGDAEVVADDGNAGLADSADDCFDVLEMLAFARTVEQDVVPVRRVKILNGFEFEAGRVYIASKDCQFVQGPELVGIAGSAPTGIGASGLIV